MATKDFNFTKLNELLTSSIAPLELVEVLNTIYADYAERILAMGDGNSKDSDRLCTLRLLTEAIKTVQIPREN